MSAGTLLMPSRTHTEDGQERRVGVEIELSGMTFERLVAHSEAFFDAQAELQSRYVSAIDSDYGRFLIELDSDPVKEFEVDTSTLPESLAGVADAALELVDAAAEKIVPLEIVGPPMALSDLQQLQSLVDYLREQGALGSRHSLHYAFGLQFNPELPSLDAATLLAYMRAFSLSYDWLKARQQLDISRKFTNYIGPWPDDYVALINRPDYQPDLATLMDDYIAHNPSRNRALDMMPLFAHLDEPRLRSKVDDPRIKPRPTLHYRLPDCDIDNPDWSFAHVWNDWVVIEELAANQDRLTAMTRAWQQHQNRGIEQLLSRWLTTSKDWLE